MSNSFNIENRRYLGSKARLLNFIHDTIEKKCANFTSFADIFAGTGNVAWSFNDGKTKIIINDFLKSNYYSYLTFFGDQLVDEKKISKIINEYNQISPNDENYFSLNFSNTYFSKKNCLKIGYIRDDIELKYINGELNDREKGILITSLLYAMDHIANTVGHYDAFRLNGELNKELVLKEPSLPNINVNKNNEIYNLDANELVKSIEADIVYIDPPYNSRQYCDAYHLLENVAEWKKPEVFGVAKKMKREKKIKSDYCTTKAPQAFDELIKNIKAKYIIVSFNNMGTKGAGRSQSKLSDEDIINSLQKRGKVEIFSVDFNQFTTGKTKVNGHQERLFVCTCSNEKKEFVKSPLNYTGGKHKLLPQLFKFFPQCNKFIDIFGGGFNVGANYNAETIIYNDKQDKVMRLIKLFYEYNYLTIIEKLEKIIYDYSLSESNKYGYRFYNCDSSKGLGSYNKIGYNNLKETYNKMPDSQEKDFYLLVLIIFGFNNQIRFNSKGEFNLPVGKRDLNDSIRDNIKLFSQSLANKKILFKSMDFFDLLDEIEQNSFIYCDPPYYLGVASYNENNGWSENDERRLLCFLEEVDKKKAFFALSNVIEHNGKEHIILKQWCEQNKYKINYINANYSNSSYHKKNKNDRSVEVLITNFDNH